MAGRGKGEHTKCAVPERHRHRLLNESWKTWVSEGRQEKMGMQFHLRILFLFMVLTTWPLLPISSSVMRSRWITLDGWVSTEQTQLLAGSAALSSSMEKAGGEGFSKPEPLKVLLPFSLWGLAPAPLQSMIISLLTSVEGLSFWRAMAPDLVSPPVMLGTKPEQLLFHRLKSS